MSASRVASADEADDGTRVPQITASIFGSAAIVAAGWTDYRTTYLGPGGGGGVSVLLRALGWLSFEARSRVTVHEERLAQARVTFEPAYALTLLAVGGGVVLDVPVARSVRTFAAVGLVYTSLFASFDDCSACDAQLTSTVGPEIGFGLSLSPSPSLSVEVRVGAQFLRFTEDAFERRLRFPEEASTTSATVIPVMLDLAVGYQLL